jgi:hypothetical protein
MSMSIRDAGDEPVRRASPPPPPPPPRGRDQSRAPPAAEPPTAPAERPAPPRPRPIDRLDAVDADRAAAQLHNDRIRVELQRSGQVAATGPIGANVDALG